MKLVPLVVGIVLFGTEVAGAQVAPAKEPEPGAPPAEAAPPPTRATPRSDGPVTFTHKGQIQASARINVGMRAIVAYDDADYCGDTDTMSSTGNAAVCTGRTPFSLDLELGYGIARKIDLIAEFRIGIEADFAATATASDEPHVFHFAPGARFFFSDARTMKLFTTAQVVFDFAGYKDAAGQDRGADFGVRNMNGLWWDLDRAYGFYAYVGETLTFGRWLNFELEAGVGISARFR